MKHTPQYEPDTISFVAWPGAGKGTVTDEMIKDLNERDIPFDRCEVGAICRDHGERQTPFGLLAEEYKDNGLLVPDGHVVPVVADAIHQLRNNVVWLVDGFPRNGNQVAPYEDLMSKLGRDDIILHLKLGRDEQEQDQISAERMIKRGERALAQGRKPRPEDIDPEKRAKRLQEARELLPVIEHFKKTGKILTIDATPSPEIVLASLRQRLAIRVFETADLAPDDMRSTTRMPRFTLYPAPQLA